MLASVDIHRNLYTVANVEYMSDAVEKAMKMFENFVYQKKHFAYQWKNLSILLIKNRIGKNISQHVFCFNEVTKAELLKEINYINNKKTNLFNAIPSKIFKKIHLNVLLIP